MRNEIIESTDSPTSIVGNVAVEGDFTGRDTITNIIVQNPEDALTIQATVDNKISQTRITYLNWIIEQNQYLDPRGVFQTQRQVQLKLDEIYIGLRAQADERPSTVDRRLLEEEFGELEVRLAASELTAEEQEDRRDALLHRLELKRDAQVARPQSPIPLAQATAQHPQLVILGDPGSGKTTLLRYLALQHAQATHKVLPQVQLYSEQTAADSKAHRTAQPTLFPILIRIADYAEEGRWRTLALSDFLPQYFDRNECKAVGMADLLQSELAQGGCLVLLDGLDEIVSADERRGIVQKIEQFVRAHDQGGPRGINRFIITSRIAGYRSAPVNAVGNEPFVHFVVEEMDLGQMEHFLERWCRAVEDAQTPDLSEDARAVTTQREVDGIMTAIRDNPGVRRLAGNPLMLRTLALIHRTGARLPQKRIELYRLAADTLARTWRTAQGVPESVLVEDHYLTPLLGHLAYWMHEHKPAGIATEQEVYDQLGMAYTKLERLPEWDPDAPDPKVMAEIKKFLQAVREHTGLFVERAPKRYGFMHLTFEEYYAARHLVARSRTRAKLIRQHLHQSRWQEPILLALGFVGLDYAYEAGELLDCAILAQGEDAEDLGLTASKYEELLGRDYLFALRCLGDMIPANRRTIDQLVARLADELLYESELVRFQAYRIRLEERLSMLADSPSSEKLIPHLLAGLKNYDYDMRSRAAASLVKLGETSNEVMNIFIADLEVGGKNERDNAAANLIKLGEFSPEAITALMAALKDDDYDVRDSAARSLGELGKASSEIITGLITALKDDNRNVRDSAAESLGELGEASSEIITALITSLKDDSWNVRDSAAGSLGKLGKASSEVITVLIATLKDEDSDVRDSAAESLVKLGEANSEVITALIAALKDDDSDVRSRAAGSLGKLGEASSEVITSLIAVLKDDNSDVRSRAAVSLAKLGEGSSEVITALITALAVADSGMMRRVAAKLIGEVGTAEPLILSGLQNGLLDDDSRVCGACAAALAQLGKRFPQDSLAIENMLVKAINDPAFEERDLFGDRTGQNYAYDGLWQLVMG